MSEEERRPRHARQDDRPITGSLADEPGTGWNRPADELSGARPTPIGEPVPSAAETQIIEPVRPPAEPVQPDDVQLTSVLASPAPMTEMIRPPAPPPEPSGPAVLPDPGTDSVLPEPV